MHHHDGVPVLEHRHAGDEEPHTHDEFISTLEHGARTTTNGRPTPDEATPLDDFKSTGLTRLERP